ncbi:MAG: hypothetical protein FJX64_09000 [Alphaproteobacteria bacterium]|nr:hypothetical protein [Alphaproteobacteria bacterium]
MSANRRGQEVPNAAPDRTASADTVFARKKPSGRDAATGRFTEGNSGRPRGALNKRTILRRALACDPPQLLQEYVRSGFAGGDPVAMRVAVARLLPMRTDAPVAFDLPALRTSADLAAASGTVIALVADGHLTPLEGTKVVAMLEKHRRALRRVERAQRALRR